MIAILSLLLIIVLSIVVTRVATIALTHTGLSKEAARFQARSAFTGAGFTTGESEKVVNHPIRRRIILLLMLLGNAGIVTAVSSLMLTFIDGGDDTSLALKIFALVGGLVLLWSLANSKWIDRHLSNFIDRLLRRVTDLDVRDYASLMHLAGEYRLAELRVRDGDWLADKTLGRARLRDEGIMVLGIRRQDGTYLGAPDGGTLVTAKDSLVLYGRASALEELDQRIAEGGSWEHFKAVEEQARQDQVEKEADRSAETR